MDKLSNFLLQKSELEYFEPFHHSSKMKQPFKINKSLVNSTCALWRKRDVVPCPSSTADRLQQMSRSPTRHESCETTVTSLQLENVVKFTKWIHSTETLWSSLATCSIASWALIAAIKLCIEQRSALSSAARADGPLGRSTEPCTPSRGLRLSPSLSWIVLSLHSWPPKVVLPPW